MTDSTTTSAPTVTAAVDSAAASVETAVAAEATGIFTKVKPYLIDGAAFLLGALVGHLI